MSLLSVRLKKTDPRAITPKPAKEGDACVDLHALEAGIVPARGRAFVRTGIAIELPHGFRGRIHSRSGLAKNHGVLAAPGVIDQGYRGEIGISLFNHSDEEFAFEAGSRVAQLSVDRMIVPYFVEVDELSPSERGESGFGSSGLEAAQ